MTGFVQTVEPTCTDSTIMTPRQAIDRLDDMQGQIIHGKRTFGEIADMLRIAQRAMDSIRDYPCGHKPNGVGGECDACKALREWDSLTPR